MSDRIYYLDEPLSDEDAAFVSDQIFGGRSVTQVRIPYVLPVLIEETPIEMHQEHEKLLRKHLRTVGITNDMNKQVVLVAPKDMWWYSVISRAIEAETGSYPWLVQTKSQRDAIKNPGETRILDMEGFFGYKDESTDA